MARRAVLVLVLVSAVLALPGRADAQAGDATITVVVDSIAGGTGAAALTDFAFIVGTEQFLLDDDQDPQYPNTRSVAVEPGTYDVTQFLRDWFESEVDCEPAAALSATPGSIAATVTVDAGDEVICTFTNTAVAALLVAGISAGPGDDPTDVELSFGGAGDGLAPVLLDDDADPTLPSSANVALPPGSNHITASGLLLDPFCLLVYPDFTFEPTGTAEGPSIDLDVEAGDVVTCIWAERGAVTLELDIPDGTSWLLRKWTFIAALLNEVFLLDDSPTTAIPDAERRTFVPGTSVAVAIEGADGWTVDLSCDHPTTEFSVPGAVSLAVPLEPGDDVTCTATATFTKVLYSVGVTTDPAGHEQDFEIVFGDDDDRPNAPLDADPDDAALPDYLNAVVDPGTYSFTQLPVDGWAVDRIVCERFLEEEPDVEEIEFAGPGATVDLEAGEVVECTIHNELLPDVAPPAPPAPPAPHQPVPEASDPCTGGNAPFDDVGPGHTHGAAIACMAALGVVTGLADGSFAPDQLVVRQQVASMLDRLATTMGSPLPDAELPFDDVEGVHAAAVARVAGAGILRGTGPRTFDPLAPMSRGQLAAAVAAFLDALAPGALPDDAGDAFADDDGSVHERSIDRLAAAGIATGRADGTFGPSDHVTRAETASFLARAFALPVG